jgi:MFS family permease
MPAFDLYFGHYDAALKILYLDSIWTSLWSSMSNVGSIVGSVIAGSLSQRFGRRYTGMGFGIVTVGPGRVDVESC